MAIVCFVVELQRVSQSVNMWAWGSGIVTWGKFCVSCRSGPAFVVWLVVWFVQDFDWEWGLMSLG